MQARRIGWVVVAGGAIGLATTALGDVVPDETFVQGWPTQVGDDFGAAVAIDGRTIVVGAPQACALGARASGRAYLFRNDGWGWRQIEELDPVSVVGGLQFGGAVAVADDVVMVGAVGSTLKGARTGAMFVYQDITDSYKPLTVFAGTDSSDGDCFGHAVAMDSTPDGLVAVVGAPGRDQMGVGLDVGAVYVLRLVDGAWVEESCLVPDDVGPGTGFGTTVDVSGDVVVAGGTGDGVWVFRTDGINWWEEAAITVPNGDKPMDRALALDGGYLAVGVPTETGGGVHVFRHGMATWHEVGVLAPMTDEPQPQFGRAVAISGTTVLVGGVDRAWLFEPGGAHWVEVERLGDYELDPSYGVVVDMADGLAVVGAPRAYEFGAVFVHDLDRTPDIDGDGVVDWNDLAGVLAAWGKCGGCAADVTGDGDVGAPDLLAVLRGWTGAED